jgi:hypothetical protein
MKKSVREKRRGILVLSIIMFRNEKHKIGRVLAVILDLFSYTLGKTKRREVIGIGTSGGAKNSV